MPSSSSSSSSSFWKKAKLGRVSRLVSDLRSKRSGGGRSSDLPLATGFPTSLADLFVKNRSRLRNSSQRHSPAKSPPPPPGAASAADHRSANSSSLSSPPSSPPPDSASSSELLGDAVELGDAEEVDRQLDGKGQGGRPSEIPILGFPLKGRLSAGSIAYLVLVLVFVTRKLAFGVTLLAIAFFLLGFAKKWLLWLLEPCENVKRLSLSSSKANLFAAKDGQKFLEDKILFRRSLNGKNRINLDEDDGLGTPTVLPPATDNGKNRINLVEEDEEQDKGADGCGMMKMKVGNLIVLVIVLCGLVGGRLVALGVTLACYILVKIAELFLKRFRSEGSV